MSNLKAQIKSIQQKLAVSQAEMIATMKANYKELGEQIARLEERTEKALTAQAGIQREALDQLLELVAQDAEETRSMVVDHEDRIRRLEGKPPAA